MSRIYVKQAHVGSKRGVLEGVAYTYLYIIYTEYVCIYVCMYAPPYVHTYMHLSDAAEGVFAWRDCYDG